MSCWELLFLGGSSLHKLRSFVESSLVAHRSKLKKDSPLVNMAT